MGREPSGAFRTDCAAVKLNNGRAACAARETASLDESALQELISLYESDRLDEAESLCRGILSRDPDHLEAAYVLGRILLDRSDPSAAIPLLRRAVKLAPDWPEVQANLGAALFMRGKLDEAAYHIRKASALDPEDAEAQNNLGVALQAGGRAREAEAAFLRALELRPDYPVARNNLGVALQAAGRAGEAAGKAQARSDPLSAAVRIDLATAECSQGRELRAVRHLRRALSIDPGHAGAADLLARIYKSRGRHEVAEELWRRAVALSPRWATAHFHLAMSLLSHGDFKEAWSERVRAVKVQPGAAPWRGHADPSGALMVHAEGGYGDDIQFVRYLGMVKSRWQGRVVFFAKPRLFPLFEASGFPVEIVSWPADTPHPREDFDAFIGLISLPCVFDTTIGTIPAEVPYLRASEERIAAWRDRVVRGSALRVGLVWAGIRTDYLQSRRSCDLPQLSALAGIPGVRFYSLQVGPEAKQIEAAPNGLEIVDLDEPDFVDTAAIMRHLDLVISIDTAPAHLAGALGLPVWVALPFAPDWRWLIDREDSPWYPTMRLFRQPKFGAWEPVWKRIADELRQMARDRGCG